MSGALEFRVIGPPGTGKTTWAGREIAARIEQGYRPSEIVLMSHTRAAALLLAEVGDIPEDNAATIHAFAYRDMGKPPIVTQGKLRAEWNKRVIDEGWARSYLLPAQTARAFGTQGISEDDIVDAVGGQAPALHVYNALRTRMIANDEELEKKHILDFVERYEAYKAEAFAVDFHDMLDHALYEMDAPLETPVRVLLVDEAQDLSIIQWAGVRHWADHPELERFIVAGDPAQVIYGFHGASVEPMLAPLPPERVRVLAKSHRLPRVIKEFAEEVLSEHSPPMMENRTFEPRDGDEGSVQGHIATYTFPQPLKAALQEQLADGKQVMLLAQSAYMLNDLTDLLIAAGIPFHNPYRREAEEWNPLSGRAGRIYSALTAASTGNQVPKEAWRTLVNMFATSAFTKGVATRARKGEIPESDDGPYHLGLTDPKTGSLVFSDETIDAILDLNWDALARLALEKGNVALQVAKAQKLHAMAAEAMPDAPPLVVVGTIHSVKGAEADVVWLVPDVSNSAWQEAMTSDEGMDALIRLMYVGITRARESLYILHPQTSRRLDALVLPVSEKQEDEWLAKLASDAVHCT